LKQQQKILAGPLIKSLPDGGDKLRQKIVEIQRILEKHEKGQRFPPNVTEMDIETNKIKNEQSNEEKMEECNVQTQEPAKSLSNELHFLQTKMDFLSLKEAKDEQMEKYKTSTKLAREKEIKGVRGLHIQNNKSRCVRNLSLQESLNLTKWEYNDPQDTKTSNQFSPPDEILPTEDEQQGVEDNEEYDDGGQHNHAIGVKCLICNS